MITPITAILDILQGRVILQDNTLVKVIKDPTPNDKTPCITIDNSGGTAVIEKHITNIGDDQVIREERSIDLDLNIWCDTEFEREEITNLIRRLFYQVQSDHYTFCSQYNDGQCAANKRACCAVNSTSFRGLKGQCPKPSVYGYENIFTKHHIIRSTFDVEPPYILDDLSTTPITLRSIIRVGFSYYDFYTIGGGRITSITLNEDIL